MYGFDCVTLRVRADVAKKLSVVVDFSVAFGAEHRLGIVPCTEVRPCIGRLLVTPIIPIPTTHGHLLLLPVRQFFGGFSLCEEYKHLIIDINVVCRMQ